MEYTIENKNWKLIDVEHFDGTSSGKGYGSIFTGKKRDDLQEAIALLRATDLGQPLQYQNFRD